MGCGQKLVGALLILFNVLLFFFGLALVVVGIWSVMDKMYVGHVFGEDLFTAACCLVLFSAAVLLVVAVVGVCAVRKERRHMVMGYFITLLVIFLLLLITAILAAAFKIELEEEMGDAMRNTLVLDYGEDTSVTQAWDRLQRDLKCCGVLGSAVGPNSGSEDLEMTRRDSWLLFQQSPWYRKSLLHDRTPVKLVPRSCCVYDNMISDYRDVAKCQTWRLGPPGNLRFNINNNALHYAGCYEKAREFIGSQADIVLGCAFAFAFSVVVGLALTFLLYRLLGEQTRIISY